MQQKIAISVILLLCTAVLFAGCTGTQTSSGTAASGTNTGSSSSGSNLMTSPTDVVPDNNAVTVTVKEKVYDGTIPVVFSGGKGQSLVKSIDVTLYTSDGRVINEKLGTNKEDEVILQGTRDPNTPDRVVVYVSEMNGQRYKVADVISTYRQH